MLFGHSILSNSLQSHGLQHARLPCPSLSPKVSSDLCPLSLWCHPTISSSVDSVSCLQSLPASGSSPMSWLFPSSGQSIGASISASVLPMNSQGWFPLGLTGLISLLSKGISNLLQYHNSKASILQCSAFFMAHISHPYMTTRKTITLTIQTFANKVVSLFFNTVSRFDIAFLPRSKHLLILWLQAPSTVILEPPKIKSVTVSTFSPSICHEVVAWSYILNVELEASFSTLLFHLQQEAL